MRNRLIQRIIIIIAFILIIGFFYPKSSIQSLCGNHCQDVGLHYSKQFCLGFKVNNKREKGNVIARCYGMPIGSKKCYGVPYMETFNFTDRELSCHYPCDDENIRISCQNSFSDLCYSINEHCKWNEDKVSKTHDFFK